MKNNNPAPNIDLESVSLLIPKARAGSDNARDELLGQIQGYVNAMAKQNAPKGLQGKFGASDVVQQSLAQVIRRFDDFRGDSAGEFYAWLKMIVKNEARQLQRGFHRNKRDASREQPIAQASGSVAGFIPTDGEPTPGTNAMAAERMERLHTAIGQLSADHAQVIELRSLQRLPFAEVAKQMDRTVGAVTKLWYRAVLRLEQELAPDDESIAR